MKNLGVFLFSGLMIFVSGIFTPEAKQEKPFIADPLLKNQTILLENKKESLEHGIETNLDYQTFLLDEIIINQTNR